MSAIKIACVGIAVLDKIYRVQDLPTQGGKFVAHDYYEVGGGPAATAAVAIARLGVEVDFLGRVGTDTASQTILSELENYGVNIQKVHKIPQAQASQSAILVDQTGERMIINYPSPTLDPSPDWLEQINFSQYDLILCDVRWHEGTLKALSLAHQHQIISLLDADLTPQPINELVELASISAFSAPGLQRYTHLTNIPEALSQVAQATDKKPLVTCGSEGCLYIDDTRQISTVKGFQVKAIDTTGAGDVFHGALAVAIAKQQPLNEAIRFANAVAALKCTQPGGRQGIPTLNETQAFLHASLNSQANRAN